MSEEQLNRIETALVGLKQDVSELRQDVSGLKQDVSELKQDVSGLKQDVSGLKQDVSGMKQDISALNQDVSGLKQDGTDLKTEMHRGFEAVHQRIGVLHEDLLNKIGASTERNAVGRQEFKEAIDDLSEKIGRRLDPLEAAMRASGFKIPKQKRARKKPRPA